MSNQQQAQWTAFHGAEEEMRRNPRGLRLFYCRKNRRIEDLLVQADASGIPAERISPRDLTARAGTEGQPRGFLLLREGEASERSPEWGGVRQFRNVREYLANAGDTPGEESGEQGAGGRNRLVLALDGITDPHNLGALLRSADIFQVDLVLYPERRAAGVTETVDRVSAGASGWVPRCQVTNLGRSLGELQEAGYWVYGADMAGEQADKTRLSGRTVIVLGREGKGLSRLIRQKVDALTAIPGAGHIDSLNVSVAGGILLYEARRQTGFPADGG